jgi:3-hydroxyacyl-CoA dehydrogenase/enoyl-CoA hydratase/3-hydroxybutyryl-CoA epimerase
MSILESLKIVPKGEIAFLEFDMVGEKANKLSTPMMMRFEEVFNELKHSAYKAVVLVSKKNKIFIAGADIEEIKSIKKREDAVKAAAGGQKVISMIEDLPMPVIAAIHGACLGGGCEMVLACDYRIATDDSSTRLGLPETKLGIIPGFGGCVRLPRVIGLQASLDIILAGKSVDGKKAEKLGLVDVCVPALVLEEYATKYAKDIVKAGKGKRRKTFEPKGLAAKLLEMAKPIVINKARQMTLKETRGNYPAPIAALDVISKTYGMSNRDKALAIEADRFGDVAFTDVSKNLIHLFYMMESIKKQTGVSDKNVKPRSIERVAVLGAGTMGGGIAQLAADKNVAVRLKDLNSDAISKGLHAAEQIWKKLLERRQITKYQYKQKLDLITGGTDFSGFKKNDLVIEAIVEDMEIKKKVIAQTAAELPENAIIATNTSSLSVTEMATAHPKPENFVGMHFFNPVNKMPLIEVIRGVKTSDEVTATIFDISKKWGKIPVVVKDGPGFLVNRLLLPYLNEAVYLFEEGMGVEELDQYFLNFGMPMGPLHLIDEIGIDVAVKVAKIFHKAFGERATPPALMSKVVEAGRLGKKNKKGFYLYDDRGKKLSVDPTIYSSLGLKAPTNPHKENVCVRRGIFAMINEAALAFHEDKIVETAQEVDLAMIMGTGFPPFRGGLLKYADSVGSEVIADELEQFSTQFGARFKASAPMKQLAKTKRTFY